MRRMIRCVLAYNRSPAIEIETERSDFRFGVEEERREVYRFGGKIMLPKLTELLGLNFIKPTSKGKIQSADVASSIQHYRPSPKIEREQVHRLASNFQILLD